MYFIDTIYKKVFLNLKMIVFILETNVLKGLTIETMYFNVFFYEQFPFNRLSIVFI